MRHAATIAGNEKEEKFEGNFILAEIRMIKKECRCGIQEKRK